MAPDTIPHYTQTLAKLRAGGGILALQRVAVRDEIAEFRRHWLPILERWYYATEKDPELQAYILSQIVRIDRSRRPRQSLETRRAQNRDRVRRFRERQRLKE